MEAPSSFTIKAKVLGERLRDTELEALLDEISDCPGVSSQVARSETLVRAVEEGKVRFLADEGCEFFPLGLGRINACGVVRTGVEDNYAVVWSIRDGFLHASEVKTFSGFREIRVGSNR